MSRWAVRPYSGKKECMYCGRPAEYRWYRIEVEVDPAQPHFRHIVARKKRTSTSHLCCGACASALGYVSEVAVDWERVRVDDELALAIEEDLKMPRRDPFKRRCYDGRMCYCAPFEDATDAQ